MRSTRHHNDSHLASLRAASKAATRKPAFADRCRSPFSRLLETSRQNVTRRASRFRDASRAIRARHSALRVRLCLMGGRADEDENGNPPRRFPARWRGTARRAFVAPRNPVAFGSCRSGGQRCRGSPRTSTRTTGTSRREGPVGPRARSRTCASPADSTRTRATDHPARRMTTRTPSSGAPPSRRRARRCETWAASGGIRGPWRGRMNIRTKESTTGRTDRRPPLANLGGNVPSVTIFE